jgi:hypothetical protein
MMIISTACEDTAIGEFNLTPRNTWTSGGKAPCFLSLDSRFM